MLQATADNEKWPDVLGALIEMTGAIKGIITLRNLETAELLLPDVLSSDLAAPLIKGIEPEFVESYLDHYAACDPWTSIERRHHPHTPYFMSDHLSIDDLRQTEFWEWLHPQGIEDAMVAEIYRSHRHWVALNLHFDRSCIGRQNEIIEQIRALLPHLKTGWKLSEELMGVRHGLVAGGGYLENWDVPCLILDEDLIVTTANALGLKELHDHVSPTEQIEVGLPLIPSNQAMLEAFNEFHGDSGKGRGREFSVPSLVPGYTISISVVAQTKDIIGKRRGNYFLQVVADRLGATSGRDMAKIWEHPALSKRQTAVIRWVAEGGEIPAFADEHGISPKTAYDHLLAARQKLNGMSARDIYTTHQAYLMHQKN